MARLCPLFSGSRGNSTYVGSLNEGILIDVGRSAKQMENIIKENGINPSSIHAIFITHEHIDHVQGLRVFASRHNIKVFASKGTIEALDLKGVLNKSFEVNCIYNEGVEIGNMKVTPFNTSHDSFESLGYIVNTCDGKKAAIATDLGFISDYVHECIKDCNAVLIESNHDIRMLQNGPYPYNLKRRILSDIGHLSNDACANEVLRLVNEGVRRFVLAHLSDENNVPELAYQTVVGNLNSSGLIKGKDFDLFVAPKENYCGETIIF